MTSPRLDRRATLVLVLVAAITYSYFQMSPAWNQMSRFALARSIVERGTLDIDEFHRATGDKGWHDGHYYSDKAPGTTFLGVPAYFIYYQLLRASGDDLPDQRAKTGPSGVVLVNRAFRDGMYWASVLSVGVFGVLGLLVFWRTCRKVAVDRGAAVLATLALGFGSTYFPYATLFYGHTLCAALLWIGFALAWRQRRDDRWSNWACVLSGLSTAGAVVCEYPAALPAAALLVYVARSGGRRRVAWFCAGAAVPAVVLGIYNTLILGAPWALGYGAVSDPEFAGMHDGFMGLTYPKPLVALKLLFGTYRGLALICPVVLLGVLGLRRMYRTGLRAEALIAGGICVYYWLLNSSYYMWWGGSSLGPRHMVPMLPFLALGLAYLPRGRWRVAAWVLLAYSALFMLVATTIGPETPVTGEAMHSHYWHMAAANHVAINPYSTNFGLFRFGITGLASAVPLLIVWAGGLAYLLRYARNRIQSSA